MSGAIALTLVSEKDRWAVWCSGVEMEPLEEGHGFILVAVVGYLVWCRVLKEQRSRINVSSRCSWLHLLRHWSVRWLGAAVQLLVIAVSGVACSACSALVLRLHFSIGTQ